MIISVDTSPREKHQHLFDLKKNNQNWQCLKMSLEARVSHSHTSKLHDSVSNSFTVAYHFQEA